MTAIIKAAGLIDTAHMSEFDRDRGSAVHEAARLVIEGTLDRQSVDPKIAGRLAQFERFLVDAKPKIIACECEVWHPDHRYAGRLDLLTDIGLIDIKGPTRAAWHGAQTAAYLKAAAEMLPYVFPQRRYTLHLSDDDYRLVRHDSSQDWPRFVEALRTYRRVHVNGSH